MSAENKIACLPIWKKDATLAERLDEMASYVRGKPERFSQFVMCYKEQLSNGRIKIRYMQEGCDLAQLIGLFEMGKIEAYKASE